MRSRARGNDAGMNTLGTHLQRLAGVLLACLPLLGSVPAVAQETPMPRAGQVTSGDETLDNAVAAVLLTELGAQFGGEPVSLRLDSVDVRPLNGGDRLVSGEGRVRVADDQEWIPFRYRTTWDATFASAGQPVVSFAGTGRPLPNDATLVRQLDEQVSTELERQAGTRTWLQLDRISTTALGSRFLRIEAGGLADLGPEGTSQVRIRALYDTVRAAWLRVNYDLD